MIKKRPQTSSTIAFIDVMACGLGAVVLLFILLDFAEIPQTTPQEPTQPIPEIVEQASSNEEEKNELTRQISVAQSQNATLDMQIQEISSQVSQLIVTEIEQQIELETLNVEVSSLGNSSEEVEESEFSGELIGMQIEGRRILLLVDVSASMSYASLVDIFVGLADQTGRHLQNGSKWIRTKDIVTWFLEELPDQSSLKAITYSENAELVANSWLSKSDFISQHGNFLDSINPFGPTNLKEALDLVNNSIKDASSIYLLTDGLPTKTSRLAVRNIGNCGISLRRGRENYVSGECREAIFDFSIQSFSQSGIPINVILLPLEGDPRAATKYRQWVATSGGKFLSPSRAWP